MSLTQDEVKHIAALARVGVDPSDVEIYQQNLSAILDYFQKLESLDTEETEAIGHITGTKNVFRQDYSEESGDLERETIFGNAPEMKNKHFKVRSVL